MKRFYFYIRYLPEHVNCEFLAGKCIRILHAYQTRFNIRSIGVSFPNWEQSSIGRTIAFISESLQALTTLSQQNYFVQMAEERYFLISGVQALPGEYQYQEFIYYRERRLEKESASAIKRELKRLQSRAIQAGVDYAPKTSERGCVEIPFAHRLSFGSSSGADFLLFIGRLECEKKQLSEFSSYGLGNRSEFKGTVPCLRPLICDR
ncbi:type I-F CRISPR-associated endoribonuclease Cas6/Csy4 [Arsukibacterium sp.]|uniref:type I-F CRISPR-associated endoribonuclease Cas6/Csy4 n=1 Tax=Arsukibacterium sp. TaxID=1977258 RepID=UPI00299EDDC6|nr:type I-F CRISPR-associated endoribonuclease Cas6/Csy4 [Arsukibacterium sp.]MDX1539593.1 type I-F CRISPR-associated endoribonuclease Cas6/Csy4 [Arsukibacterium sp.]